MDLLAALADQSLLTVQTLGRSEARYSLPETVRQYAQEKLAACGEASRLGERHLEHTLKTVEEVEHKLTGPYQQLWLVWLDGEYNEVRAGIILGARERADRSGVAHRACHLPVLGDPGLCGGRIGLAGTADPESR